MADDEDIVVGIADIAARFQASPVFECPECGTEIPAEAFERPPLSEWDWSDPRLTVYHRGCYPG